MFDIIIFTDSIDGQRVSGAHRIADVCREQGYNTFVMQQFSEVYRRGLLFDYLDKLVGENTFMVGFSSTFFSCIESYKEDNVNGANRDTYSGINPLTAWPLPVADMDKILDYFTARNIKTVYGRFFNTGTNLLKDRVDYAIYGVGEQMMIDLIDHVRNGKKIPFDALSTGRPKVLKYDSKGTLFNFKTSQSRYEPWDLIDHHDMLHLEIARGCIFNCKFCGYPLIGKRKDDDSYTRTKEVLKAELKENYEKYGVTRYHIVDDTFNEKTEKVKMLAEAVEETGVKIDFAWAYIRIELLHKYPEQLDYLYRAGVRMLRFGLESLNWESAKAIGKGLHPDKIKETLAWIQEKYPGHFISSCSFIIGLPHDTEETVSDWLEWIYQHPELIQETAYHPLSLQTEEDHGEWTSEFGRNYKDYGYDVVKGMGWINDDWSERRVNTFLEEKRIELGNKYNRLSAIGRDSKEPKTLKQRREENLDVYMAKLKNYMDSL